MQGSAPFSEAEKPKGKSSTEKFAEAERLHGHLIDSLSETEKAALGLPYVANEPALVRARLRARRLLHEFNHSLPSSIDPPDLQPGEKPKGIGGGQNATDVPPDVMGQERRKIMAKLLNKPLDEMQAVEIEPPFWCDYGTNIKLEGAFYCNWNTSMVDCAEIWIGNGTLFGPNVHIYAGTHSVSVTEREQGIEHALPIKIGRDCWLGGNVTVMAGVTIGDGCTIGANSTVTRDIPSYSVAAGTPARVLKTLQPEERGVEWLQGQKHSQ
jgi:maltose O-acetyltransferase